MTFYCHIVTAAEQICLLLQVPFSPWDSTSTTVCLTVLGEKISDVYGTTFPDGKNCTGLDHRQALDSL